MSTQMPRPEIRSYNNSSNAGFQLTFLNGWTISVMFGWSDDCESRLANQLPAMYNQGNRIVNITGGGSLTRTVINAAVAVWDGDSQYTVAQSWGWCHPDKVADLIAWTKGLSKDIKNKDLNDSTRAETKALIEILNEGG